MVFQIQQVRLVQHQACEEPHTLKCENNEAFLEEICSSQQKFKDEIFKTILYTLDLILLDKMLVMQFNYLSFDYESSNLYQIYKKF